MELASLKEALHEAVQKRDELYEKLDNYDQVLKRQVNKSNLLELQIQKLIQEKNEIQDSKNKYGYIVKNQKNKINYLKETVEKMREQNSKMGQELQTRILSENSRELDSRSTIATPRNLCRYLEQIQNNLYHIPELEKAFVRRTRNFQNYADLVNSAEMTKPMLMTIQIIRDFSSRMAAQTPDSPVPADSLIYESDVVISQAMNNTMRLQRAVENIRNLTEVKQVKHVLKLKIPKKKIPPPATEIHTDRTHSKIRIYGKGEDQERSVSAPRSMRRVPHTPCFKSSLKS